MTTSRTSITGHTRYAAVLGYPVEHSLSPVLHNAAFSELALDAVMIPLAVPPSHLVETVRSLLATQCLGASVTLPHKQAVMAACDQLAPAAKRIGAVNCLAFEAGEVIGLNTDGDGFADGLAEQSISLRGKRVLLLGAGGAARAVAWGVRDARAIEIIARRPSALDWAQAWPWEATYLQECFARADVVIDCTSTALAPSEAEDTLVESLPWDALRPHTLVASLVYHRQPALLTQATARELPTMNGAAMLLHQGARAFARWTGEPAPVAVMRQALHDALTSR